MSVTSGKHLGSTVVSLMIIDWSLELLLVAKQSNKEKRIRSTFMAHLALEEQ